MTLHEEIDGPPGQMTGKRYGNARFVARLGADSFETPPTSVVAEAAPFGGVAQDLSIRPRGQHNAAHFHGH